MPCQLSPDPPIPSGLISQFRPDSIDFYDFQNDINVLPRSLRLLSASLVADANNVALVDRCESEAADTAGNIISDQQTIRESRAPIGKALLLALYSWTIHAVSSMRACLSKSSRRALLLVNTNVLGSLLCEALGSSSANGLLPIAFCRTVPKDAALITKCIKANVFLARARSESLSKADVSRIAYISGRLQSALLSASPNDDTMTVTHAYIKEVLLANGTLMTLAGTVNRAARDIAALRPDKLLSTVCGVPCIGLMWNWQRIKTSQLTTYGIVQLCHRIYVWMPSEEMTGPKPGLIDVSAGAGK